MRGTGFVGVGVAAVMCSMVFKSLVAQSFQLSFVQVLLVLVGVVFLGLLNINGYLLTKPSHPVVEELWLFPVKSCAGIRVKEAVIDRLGFVGDRRYMIVTSEGKFLTQREHPRMRLIVPRLLKPDASLIELTAPDMPPVTFGLHSEGSNKTVTVWKSNVEAHDVGDEAAQWVEKFLGLSARVVSVLPNDSHIRPMNPKYAVNTHALKLNGDEHDKVQVAFSDGYPLHLITVESLTHLNKQIAKNTTSPDTPLKVDNLNFRANIVVRGASRAYDEDYWLRFALSSANSTSMFSVVKPCDRCVLPTVQASGTFHPRFEPRRTLSKCRSDGENMYFGQNVVQNSVGGVVREGDVVVVMQKAEQPTPNIPTA